MEDWYFFSWDALKSSYLAVLSPNCLPIALMKYLKYNHMILQDDRLN
jgi:hypothetical protein